jgi:hypothetical protein
MPYNIQTALPQQQQLLALHMKPSADRCAATIQSKHTHNAVPQRNTV